MCRRSCRAISRRWKLPASMNNGRCWAETDFLVEYPIESGTQSSRDRATPRAKSSWHTSCVQVGVSLSRNCHEPHQGHRDSVHLLLESALIWNGNVLVL